MKYKVDQNEQERIKDAYFDPMIDLLRLTDWNIKVVFETIDANMVEQQQLIAQEVHADCTVLHQYRYALIRIDPACTASEQDLKTSLRHELLHCVFSELTQAGNIIYCNSEHQSKDLESMMMSCALESAINNVEKLLDGFGFWQKLEKLVK